MTKTAILIDPYHRYAEMFIDLIHTKWGIKTVALYTDRTQLLLQGIRFPILRSEAIEASYYVDEDDILAIAPQLQALHDIVAVIPHAETYVLLASELASALGLDWAQGDTIDRFRDKFRLKSYIARQPDAPRINLMWSVTTAQDVAAALADSDIDRFVLKPNDGFGNMNIGFFDRSSDAADIKEHLELAKGHAMMMEEFIAGPEYHVNGQIDGEGNVEIYAIFRYYRGEMYGKPNSLFWEEKVSQTDPVFTALADYLTAVMTASGLRRSPFHAEALVDATGPCLVEVGARLCGADCAFTFNLSHGEQLNVFELAAHYYLSSEPLNNPQLDWTIYNGRALGTLYGFYGEWSRVYSLSGIDTVEARPDFLRWARKPEIADNLEPTLDVGAHPWFVTLASPQGIDFPKAQTELAATIKINESKPTISEHLGVATVLAEMAAQATMQAGALRPKRLVPRDQDG